MNQRHVKQKGFSLIEVMVTVLIVSVGMLAMAGLLVASIKTNAASESRMDAASLAQSVMTRIAAKATITAGYSQATADTDAQAMLGSRYNFSGLSGGYYPTVFFRTDAGVPTDTVAGAYTVILVSLKWNHHGTLKAVELRSGAVTNNAP